MSLQYRSFIDPLYLSELFTNIVSIADSTSGDGFWDSAGGTTAVVGDITITLGTSNLTISGAGFSFTFGSSTNNAVIIAATKNSLICKAASSVFALGKNSAGKWGAVYTSSGSIITSVIADGLSSASFRPNTNLLASQASTVNTQFIDISAAYGNFTFSDVFFVLMSPSPSYTGRMTLNNERYVQLNCLAIRGTD